MMNSIADVTHRRCRVLLPWLALACAAGQPARAGESGSAEGLSIGLSVNRHLDPAPLTALGGDDIWLHMRPRAGDNLAYMADEAHLSVLRGAWRWSLLARERASIVASGGALQLGRVVEVTGAPSADQRWSVGLRALGFAGVGGAVQHDWRFGDAWRLSLGAQALRLTRLVERDAQGEAAYAADDAGEGGTYSFDLSSREANDRLTFPFQRPAARSGQALLSQGELTWDDGCRRLSLGWRDAGWLRWRGLPQQQLQARSDTRTVDADGYVVYGPLLVGQNSQPVYRRWLQPWWDVSAAWTLPGLGTARLAAWRLPGWGWLPRVEAQAPVGGWDLALGWHLHERRAELRALRGGWQLGLGADRVHSLHSMSWTLGWQGRWGS